MTTKEELEILKKQIADLEAKIANEEKQEIKSVEDAWNKLKPRWNLKAINHFTSQKEAKRVDALIQLRLIAEAMNEGVERHVMVHGINNFYELVYVRRDYTFASIFPIFHTKELAQQALRNFKHLFEDLYAS